jgi:hypothetical protein
MVSGVFASGCSGGSGIGSIDVGASKKAAAAREIGTPLQKIFRNATNPSTVQLGAKEKTARPTNKMRGKLK